MGGQVGHTRMLFTTHKISVRLKGQKFLPLSALWGSWESDSISSVSGQWSGSWIFDFLGLSSVRGCRMEWNSSPTLGTALKNFPFMSGAHSVAHQCFWLRIVNRNSVWIFLLSPSHLLISLFLALACLFQSLSDVDIKRAAAGLNWESRGLMWDSQHSSIQTRTVRPRVSCSLSPSLKERDQYYLFFKAASVGRIKLELGLKEPNPCHNSRDSMIDTSL